MYFWDIPAKTAKILKNSKFDILINPIDFITDFLFFGLASKH